MVAGGTGDVAGEQSRAFSCEPNDKEAPQRAFEVARRSLKQGYRSELVRVVEELKTKDAELASKLTNEIIDKLLNEKLSHEPTGGPVSDGYV